MSEILYHHSPCKNRHSIFLHGLQGKYDQTVNLNDHMAIGGVFLTNKAKTCTESDIWEVDVSGLEIEDDWSSTPEDTKENWYVIYADIPPDRLKRAR